MSKILQGGGTESNPFIVSSEDYKFIATCCSQSILFEMFPQFKRLGVWPPLENEKVCLKVDSTLNNNCICDGTGMIQVGPGQPSVACTCRKPSNRLASVIQSIKEFNKLVNRYEQGETGVPWVSVRANLRELVDEIDSLS